MMSTVLDRRGSPAPTENPGAPSPPEHTAQPSRSPYRIHLRRDVASELGRYVSAITAKTASGWEPHRGNAGAPELVIDLSDAAQVPLSPLVLLVDLLRGVVGHGTTITLSGVRPMILGSLVAYGVPEDVVVIDNRGRRWVNGDRRRTDT